MAPSDIVKWILSFFELAAAVTGFYYLSKWKGTRWVLFPYFLLLTLITELVAKYMYDNDLAPYLYIVYRYINIPATMLFYLYMIYYSFASPSLKKSVLVIIAVYVVCWLLEEFVLRGRFLRRSTISYLVAVIGMLVFIVIWFTKLVRGAKLLQYKRDMYFWLYSGILAYYVITLPFTSELRHTLNETYPMLVWEFWYASMFFNYIMYSFFIIGIKWAKPKSSYPL